MFGFAPFAGVPFATNVGAMLNGLVIEQATASVEVIAGAQFDSYDMFSN